MLAGSAVVIITTLTLIDATVLTTEAQSTLSHTQSANNTSVDPDISNQEQSPVYQSGVTPTVKITYPQKGQMVPVGELTVHGISSGNTDCDVLVILNGIKPYQPVSPTGFNDSSSFGDDDDYATWSYTLTPKYALIKEGENKITSKIVCQTGEGNPSVSSNLKHYSVNVTGFDNGTASPLPVSPKNASGHSDTSSYSLYNGNVFVIPMPNNLFSPTFQANDLENNEEALDSNDNSEATLPSSSASSASDD
jgi:hypothetical protein